MNTAPVTSALSADILQAVALALTQASGSEVSSKFRDVFQNLPSAPNQGEDGQASNPKSVLPKKKLSPGDDATAVSPTPAASNNAATTNPALTLSLALPKPTPAPQVALPEIASPQAESPQADSPQAQATQPGPTDAHTSEPTGSSAREPIKGSQLRQLPPSGSAVVLAQRTPLTTVALRSDRIVTASGAAAANVLSEASPRTSLPAEEQFMDLRSGSAQENAPGPASSPASTAPDSSFPVNAANLAFAMQLTQNTTGEPAPSGTEATKPAAALTASNATASHDFPKIAVLPNDARSSAHSDASSREPRNFEKPKSATNAPVHTKSETTAPRLVSTPAEDPGAALEMNRSTAGLNQPLAGATAWMGAAAHIDTRPSAILADQPAPASPPISTPPHVQLNVDAPKTSLNNGILLNLGNGQTSAAVRVVDRAGTVSVSVHAPGQELRNTLRSNLSDLTTQLNSQGLKTEVLKTAAAQPTAEGRQQPNSQDQRSQGQHQPSTQNQQQSQQRDRRSNNRWLDELAAQADASSENSGDKKS